MSERLIAIDPGPTESAFVVLKDRELVEWGKIENDRMVNRVGMNGWYTHAVIEMVQSFGKPVGSEVFETCVWVGRFMQAAGGIGGCYRLTRHEIKMHLCQATQGVNDSVIRQRLIDLYGGKAAAIGNKKTPGPLYGIKGDCWQALAVGYVWLEKNRRESR